MYLNTVKAFRHDIYRTFSRAKDALFNLVDALVSEDRAQSLVELSLSPQFERRWPSVYEALEDGRIDEQEMQEVFLRYRPQETSTGLVRLAIDTTGIARPKAQTSQDRSAQTVHNLPEGEQAITHGWTFSTVAMLPEHPGSWTYTLSQHRVDTASTAQQTALTQVRQLLPQLPSQTMVLLDRNYDSAWLWCQLRPLPIMGTLIRLKKNRCFYRPAPAPTGKRGAPRKRGDKLQPNDDATHANPSGTWFGQDPTGREVGVSWWNDLHLKEAMWMHLTVLRVQHSGASGSARDPHVSWFVWIGKDEVDWPSIVLEYRHRFSIEHGYRFDKQALLWDKPHLRTPEQFERWSLLVAVAHNHLVVARSLVTTHLRPWENRQRVLSPQQVRRGMSLLLPQLGTPACAPQPRGKSPGQAKGAKRRKAQRFAIVRQRPKVPPLPSG